MGRNVAWTLEELRILREAYFNNVSSSDMGLMFPERSISAIQTRITMMGLRTPRKTKIELRADMRKRVHSTPPAPPKFNTTPCAQRELG